MGKIMRGVLTTGPGEPSVLYLGETDKPSPGPGEVLIRIHATAVNRADTLQRKGLYPPPPGESTILGLEAAGEVIQLGAEVTGVNLGDRVMALLPGGGYAEYAAVCAGHLLPVPPEYSWQQAAAIPEVWLTAFQLLKKVGRMESGEKVLIHAGGSGVGTAAVQLVKLFGGESIVTAGSQEKIDKAISLGALQGINYKTEDFAARVMELTGGRGVDLILDCVGGSYVDKNVASLAMDGRWVLYGLMGGGQVESGPLLAKLLRRRIAILPSTLRTRSNEYKSQLIEDFKMAALPHFQTKLHPIIDSVLGLDRVVEAHTIVEGNRTNGKVILTVKE